MSRKKLDESSLTASTSEKYIKTPDGTISVKGYNKPAPDPYGVPYFEPPKRVAHEDIDNDDLRKQENRYRHSSYRK